MGLSRLELPTSPLSGVRSNHLSYRPVSTLPAFAGNVCARSYWQQNNLCEHCAKKASALRKEVIQPQVPLRLPCYDFTPVMKHKVVIAPPKVRLTTSFASHSHGVTGGVYKARERIHRSMLTCDY